MKATPLGGIFHASLVAATFLAVLPASQAGVYQNDFQGYSAGTVQLGGGTTTFLTDSFATNSIVQVFNGGDWQGYRLSQDNETPVGGQAVLQLPDLDPGKAITSFTATFDLLVKNDKGNPADGFSLTFGNLNTGVNYPQAMEQGLLANSGSTLAASFITYDLNSNKGVYARLNTTSVGPNITRTNSKDVYVSTSTAAANFRTVSISWSQADGLSLSYDGTAVYSNVALSFTPQAGYTFGFAARTGALDEDVFIDNINIQTVPEPAAIALVLVGLPGMVLALRRRRP